MWCCDTVPGCRKKNADVAGVVGGAVTVEHVKWQAKELNVTLQEMMTAQEKEPMMVRA